MRKGILILSIMSVSLYNNISYGAENRKAHSEINVQVTVNPFCRIQDNIKNVDLFYNPFRIINLKVGNLNFECVKGTLFKIKAISYHNPNGDVGIMEDSNGNKIHYYLSGTVYYNENGSSATSGNLFRDSIQMVAPTKDKPYAFVVSIAFGGQNAPIGHYRDTVEIDITY